MYISHINNTPTSLYITCEVITGHPESRRKFKDSKLHLIKLLWPRGGLKDTAKRTIDNIKLSSKKTMFQDTLN